MSIRNYLLNNANFVLTVQNMGIGVDAVLKQFGGKGKATGCVVLHLSPDNRRVDKAKFVVRGELEEKEIRMECSKLWQDADLDTIVTIRFPKSDIFKFEEGGLWSELVPMRRLSTISTPGRRDKTQPQS